MASWRYRFEELICEIEELTSPAIERLDMYKSILSKYSNEESVEETDKNYAKIIEPNWDEDI